MTGKNEKQVKQECKHCKVNCKIERLREHLKKCRAYAIQSQLLTVDSSHECANMDPVASAAAHQIHEKQIQQHNQTRSEFFWGRQGMSVDSTSSSS